jgi:hypothetical protein
MSNDTEKATVKIRGFEHKLESGSTIFVGHNFEDVFIKYKHVDGHETPLRLSKEAALATMQMIDRIFEPDGERT